MHTKEAMYLVTTLLLVSSVTGCTTSNIATTPADTSAATTSDDQQRLANYKNLIAELKTNKCDVLGKDFNAVTNQDLDYSAARNAEPRPEPVATYTPSYSSSSSSYSSSGSASAGTLTHQQQYHYDNAIKEAAEADAAMARGDLAAAREHKKWADANVQNYHELGGH